MTYNKATSKEVSRAFRKAAKVLPKEHMHILNAYSAKICKYYKEYWGFENAGIASWDEMASFNRLYAVLKTKLWRTAIDHMIRYIA